MKILSGIKKELGTVKRLIYRQAYKKMGSGDQGRTLIDDFSRFVYDSAVLGKGWTDCHWMGVPVLKMPTDLWVYQEILYQIKPDVVIETGSAAGGSAVYFGSLMDLLGKGRVISIDIEKRNRPAHPRVTYLTGSSTDPEIFKKVESRIKPGNTVLVILDSDHSEKHVTDEMNLYWPVVSVGSYMVVEDTTINGHPVGPDFGPGPMEAVDKFLSHNKNFAVQDQWEKYFITANPRGYLKRIK